MKNSLVIICGLTLVTSLAACKKEAEAPKPTETTAAKTGDMSEMPMTSAAKHGNSTGTVTAIDAAKGTLTLDHGEIAALQWPAMKMEFSATPHLLSGIKVGDKVEFEIEWDGKAGVVTAMNKSR